MIKENKLIIVCYSKVHKKQSNLDSNNLKYEIPDFQMQNIHE